MDKKFKEVNNILGKFEKVGSRIEGTYIGKKVAGNFGNDAYGIKTAEGEVTIFGTAILDRKMNEVPAGKYVRITYMGDLPNPKKGQNPIKDFKVEIQED